jgi:FkbM family methyltransferase
MRTPARKIAFVLASTDCGSLIINRFDYHRVNNDQVYGVGHEILETGSYNPSEVALVIQLLDFRRKYFGDGVIALDCGANIGVHTIQWSKRMGNWGEVIAFEAQERVYYALAGNIAINNCFNARAFHCALGDKNGSMRIPSPDYYKPASFGSLELKMRDNVEYIGQEISYNNCLVGVDLKTIDSVGLTRVDLIKIDVEGMELEVLAGGSRCILENKPLLLVESIKVDRSKLTTWLAERQYNFIQVGLNLLAIHKEDPCSKHIHAQSP